MLWNVCMVRCDCLVLELMVLLRGGIDWYVLKGLVGFFLCSLLGIVMGFGGLVFRACFCVSEVDTLKRTIMG